MPHPRIPKVNFASITMGEVEDLKLLCTAYAAELGPLETPQEQPAYLRRSPPSCQVVKRAIGRRRKSGDSGTADQLSLMP